MVNSLILRVVSAAHDVVATVVAVTTAATIVWWMTTMAAHVDLMSTREWPILVHLILVLALSLGLIGLWRRFLVFIGTRSQFSLRELGVGVLLVAVFFATIGRKVHSVARQEIAPHANENGRCRIRRRHVFFPSVALGV